MGKDTLELACECLIDKHFNQTRRAAPPGQASRADMRYPLVTKQDESFAAQTFARYCAPAVYAKELPGRLAAFVNLAAPAFQFFPSRQTPPAYLKPSRVFGTGFDGGAFLWKTLQSLRLTAGEAVAAAATAAS